ncbi:hypothetical protein QQF64_012292 [Cirrhinus molitorella]|uniref:Uncharacterized protein n=1 Tax=Cirrhinus molitorella TaxID=172907 RepID=A0ABR3LV08_9TELE
MLGNDALTSQIFHGSHSRSSNMPCVWQTVCLPIRVFCLIRWFALRRNSARYPGCFLGNACRQEEMWVIHTRKSSGRVQTVEEPMRISLWHKRGANVTSTECCSERKLSLLTLKLRAVHLISITAQAERTRSAHGREQKAVTGEDGDAARSEREDLIKTTNINEENGVDLFRRKSRSRRCEHGIRTAG